MLPNGISVVRKRKHKVTTDSDHTFKIAQKLLDRNFSADQPNQKWAGDITYIWKREGWLYLAVILDLHSRRVIGRAVSNRRQYGFQVSMSGKGNCYDNAAVETFFKTFKAKLSWRRSWHTRRQDDGDLRIRQWALQSTTPPLSIGLEKSGRI